MSQGKEITLHLTFVVTHRMIDLIKSSPDVRPGWLRAQYATNQRGRQGSESFQCNDLNAIPHAAPPLRRLDHNTTRSASGTRRTRLSETLISHWRRPLFDKQSRNCVSSICVLPPPNPRAPEAIRTMWPHNEAFEHHHPGVEDIYEAMS